MKFFSFLLIPLSLSTMANECDIAPNVLSAYYDVNFQTVNAQLNEQNKNKETSKPIEKRSLHRNNNSVLKQNSTQGIHNIWTIHGERISLNRVFEQYKHVIEYQSNELRYQPQWQDIKQIVALPEWHKFKKLTHTKSGCNEEHHYSFTVNDNKWKNGNDTDKTSHKQSIEYNLVWLPNLALIKFFEIKSDTYTKQWLLTDYQHDPEIVSTMLNQYNHYQSTDYADIGDNETIPFLAAMINQGFSNSSNQRSVPEANSATHHH